MSFEYGKSCSATDLQVQTQQAGPAVEASRDSFVVGGVRVGGEWPVRLPVCVCVRACIRRVARDASNVFDGRVVAIRKARLLMYRPVLACVRARPRQREASCMAPQAVLFS
jgi:hypothetical protein